MTYFINMLKKLKLEFIISNLTLQIVFIYWSLPRRIVAVYHSISLWYNHLNPFYGKKKFPYAMARASSGRQSWTPESVGTRFWFLSERWSKGAPSQRWCYCPQKGQVLCEALRWRWRASSSFRYRERRIWAERPQRIHEKGWIWRVCLRVKPKPWLVGQATWLIQLGIFFI